MTETKYGTLPFIKMPTTIPELVDYIKKSLGHPIIKIEVTDEQFYLRIMNTLIFFQLNKINISWKKIYEIFYILKNNEYTNFFPTKLFL